MCSSVESELAFDLIVAYAAADFEGAEPFLAGLGWPCRLMLDGSLDERGLLHVAHRQG